MGEIMKTDRADVLIHVETIPVKSSGDAPVEPALLEAQAAAAVSALVEVDYHAARGTCGDERERVGLLNGSTEVEPRPSVFGGPNIHALAIAELTGVMPKNTETGEDALRLVTRQINAAGIRSGGHAKCAANAGFPVWMSTIANNVGAVVPYVEKQTGSRFDSIVMAEVSRYARQALASGRYDEWDEDVLVGVLGDEAGEAIEILADKPHEGVVLERVKIPGKTVDQTTLCRTSVLGEGSFVVDDPYAEEIEAAVTSGPDAVRKMLLAAHAREAIIAAIAGVVPNPELYQDTLI